VIDLEKKTISKKRVASTSEEEKHAVAEETHPDDEEPARKRARIDPIAETDEDIDILSTSRIEPSTRYPPKGKALKAVKEMHVASSAGPDELEEREARGKRVAEIIQKQIAMANSAPTECVAGLVDVIDEIEELCYIDDDTPVEVAEKESFALKVFDDQIESAMGPGESSGLKPHDPIDLDTSEVEKSAAGQSHSPPPVLGDAISRLWRLLERTRPHSSKKPMFFSLKKQVCFLDLSSIFLVFLMNIACYRLTPFGPALLFSSYNFGHTKR
jgi:hypothetical protein